MKQRLVIVAALFFIGWPVASAQTKESSAPSSQTGTVRDRKPLAAKDDISAIGHRKVGNKGLGNWYSLETDIAMGKQYAQLVETNAKLLDDAVITEYVNRIGQNLVRNSDAVVPFTIKVADSDELNAFALPGGVLYVNYGIILTAENEAQLAGVMAHEIAHVAARHATRQMTRSNLINLVSIPLIFTGGGAAAVQAIRLATKFAAPIGMFRFSRSFEAEADYLGLEYVYAAGYDPLEFISLIERVGAQKQKKSGRVVGLFATHPNTSSRIKKGQEEIARILPPRDSYIVNTSEFEEVKQRLLEMGTGNGRAPGEPTLRQRSAPALAVEGNIEAQREDDRPRLKLTTPE